MMHFIQKSITAFGLIGVIFLTGCSSNNDNDNTGDSPTADGTPPSTVLDAAGLELLEGNWQQRGYGNLYAYADDRTTWYALNENTCLEIASFPGLVGFSPDELAQTRYALDGEQLTLSVPGEAFDLRFNRLADLPERCSEQVPNDAQAVFDYLWSTYDEFYAFFDLRGVDWDAEFARVTPRVSEAVDDATLFTVLSDLLSPIDDGHVVLANDAEFFSPAVERGAGPELRRGFDAQSDITDFIDYVDSVLDQLRSVIVSNLDIDSIAENGPLAWGTTNGGSIGYLFIESMDGYATDENGNQLDDPSSAEDLAAASAAMDEAMADLTNTGRLIIDLRLNGGGSDSISVDFAQRFISERQLFFSKTARSRDFESAPIEAYLEPVETPYLNPVTLIVGPNTASAAETFAIPLQLLPQVTVIGERTEGILSDILVKPLPNNWITGLSNEVYLDAEGVSHEGTGVPVDIDVPVFLIEDIEAGVDQALERALSLQ